MSDRDIVDRIDELVDEQLANYDRRTGYDYNVGAERCPHCLEEWHGLPITETVRSMRSRYGYDPRVPGELDSYRADGDESAVWCPGSTFVGPWANPAQLARIRAGATGAEAWSLPENPFEPGRWTLPELSFPVPECTLPATSLSWSLHADTGRYEQGEPLIERLDMGVVLAGTVEHRDTSRGDRYVAGHITVRDVSPRALESDMLARGVWVAVAGSRGIEPTYARVHAIERVDYGGPAWRVSFDQRRTLHEYVRVPGSRPTRRRWQAVVLVEPSPPVPWGPDHPHYRYSRGEQLRLARQEDTRGGRAAPAPTRERGWSLAELESLRRMMSTQNPWLPDTLVDPGAPWLRTGGRRNGRHTAIPGGRAPDTVRDALVRLQATIAEIYDECSVPVRSWTLGDPEPGTPEPELDDRGRPRPPRPSTTPPMWANNPTRTNRRRNR
ncbi:hypothetical protein [Rhodococcus sp. A5(2022)]|uniref:hypothetical protein n=1 Tax=Rhodococcus sp. A5(2022) TaxID=3003588 RepID=UPI0022A81FE0|nr:hypothetical protein [Rhodococcus sp. A5(2022)]MCZ1070806.1 hypothetical protein [Rhodococcus sp. A5(2022)]